MATPKADEFDIDLIIESAVACLRSQWSTAVKLIGEDGSLKMPQTMRASLINSVVGASHVLVVNSSAVYFIHGPILARGSAFFASLLAGRFKEGKEDVLRVVVPFPDGFPQALVYFYTNDSGSRFYKDIPKLLANARYLAADMLVKLCIQELGGAPLQHWGGLDNIDMDVQLAADIMDATLEKAPSNYVAAVQKLAMLAVFKKGQSCDKFGVEVKARADTLISKIHLEKLKQMSTSPGGKRVLIILGLEGFAKLTQRLKVDGENMAAILNELTTDRVPFKQHLFDGFESRLLPCEDLQTVKRDRRINWSRADYYIADDTIY
ncbi:hypothetical protein HK101_001245 [Irineochytrium annulatum]|nr:hypothetical protein HK101_001245 [Irineochytrium annulatum]